MLPLRVHLFAFAASTLPLIAQPKEPPREFLPPPFDRYFAARVAELSGRDWRKEITPENWPSKQAAMREDLQGMLGLKPWPERSALQPVITGTVQGDGYVIEKLHFQSMPSVYVTANFYRPVEVPQPLPAILYVCGHSNVVENGISMGNKTDYQHHGIWFARNGYVCLTLDTIQLGEIRGFHHGTYNLGRWWWPARGYTPAGVEAWNGIRALDYLETRPEVDRTRLGITGRSGGGAYSWWTAGLDERIKVAVPVAGITSLHNHVIDGAIEGHCDCMFMLNTARWDFDRVATLIAPRPLLIANTDKDTIFPLDGVVEVYNRARAVYKALGQEAQIGLHIAEGPHKDMQPLNVAAFHWFNRFLKGADLMQITEEPARKARTHLPRDLKVFAELPKDEKVTTVDEFFVPAYSPKTEAPSAAEWPRIRDHWLKALREECFRAWSLDQAKPAAARTTTATADGLRLTIIEAEETEPFAAKLWVWHREDLRPEQLESIVLFAVEDQEWSEFQAAAAVAFPAQFPGAAPDRAAFEAEKKRLFEAKSAIAVCCPRGVGPTSLAAVTERKRTQMLRRFHLLGESLESGQVSDIARAAATLRSVPSFARAPLVLRGKGVMGANALYASLYIPNVKRLELHSLPSSHRDGPIYLNVLRHLDLPQSVALAAERSEVVLHNADASPWRYSQSVATSLGWGEKRVQILPASGSLPGPR